MSLTTRALALTFAMFVGLAANQQVVSADTTQSTGPFTRMVEGLNPANWTMPKFNRPTMPSFKKLLPGQEEKQQIIKKKDGLVGEVSKTASNSWNKTKDTLNPMKMASWRPFSGEPTQERPEEKSPGFFSSLFQGPQPEEEKPTTVTDFLGQSKPNP